VNFVGRKEAKLISEALKKNDTLTELNLEGYCSSFPSVQNNLKKIREGFISI